MTRAASAWVSRSLPARGVPVALRLGLAVLMLLLAGCATTRGGPTSFLTTERAPATNMAMRHLVDANTEDKRNQHLAAAMADVDIYYVEFRDELLRSDNTFNASVDLASLAADIAGGLAGSLGAKDNYLALGALLTGGRATVSNRFLYTQTGMALIKGMDAARTDTALAIKTKQMRHSIQEYTGRDAYADVLKYYFDGTLAGGLIWLQSQAETVEAETKVQISTLRVPTPEAFEARGNFHDDVRAAFATAKVETLRKILDAWEIPYAAQDGKDDLQLLVQGELRRRMQEGEPLEGLRNQLVELGLLGDAQ